MKQCSFYFFFFFLSLLSRDFLILLPRFCHGETSNENHRLSSALRSIGRGKKKKDIADWYQEFIAESLSIGYLQGKNAMPIEAVSVLSKQKLLIKRNKDSKASRIFIIIKRYAVRIFPIVVIFSSLSLSLSFFTFPTLYTRYIFQKIRGKYTLGEIAGWFIGSNNIEGIIQVEGARSIFIGHEIIHRDPV